MFYYFVLLRNITVASLLTTWLEIFSYILLEITLLYPTFPIPLIAGKLFLIRTGKLVNSQYQKNIFPWYTSIRIQMRLKKNPGELIWMRNVSSMILIVITYLYVENNVLCHLRKFTITIAVLLPRFTKILSIRAPENQSWINK